MDSLQCGGVDDELNHSLPKDPDMPSHRRLRSMEDQNLSSQEKGNTMRRGLQKIHASSNEFTLQLIKHMTNHFSEENIIGRGGSGVVYKGLLDNGEQIAMKKLYQMPGLDEKQFTNEFNNLMRAKHKNIIRLVGYCYYLGHERIEHEGKYVFAHVQERVLCYEYLPGGNLDEHISDESCGLDWHTRYKIITGVCEGLNFLHMGSDDRICHLDLKPANILLDKNMIPKIADFGLSRLFVSAQTHMTTKIMGTFGYMPPEFIERGKITPKFDIFSLGVIIIKIIAGPDGYSKFADTSSQEFKKQVHENWAKRLHATMASDTSQQEIKTCLDIALRCVERDEVKRPCISEIIGELDKIGSNIRDEIGNDIVDEQDKLDGAGAGEKGNVDADILYKRVLRSPLDIFPRRCVWVNGPIIVGAGPSGLAVAASLREQGLPFVVLEREDCIASLWQKRTYDCLKLNRPKHLCELPRMPFPDHFPEYLTRRQFIDYLEEYAAYFDIKPEFSITVLSAGYDDTSGLWRVRAEVEETDGADIEYISRWLVAATGANAEKIVPDIPGLSSFCGEVIHSSDYRSGESYRGKRVVVVGCGQSGVEVSADLCNYGVVPFIVVRNMLGISSLYLTVLLMRWLPPLLVDKIMVLLAWLVVGDLARLGIRTPAIDPVTLNNTNWCVTARKIRSGEITAAPAAVMRFTKSSAELSDGTVLDIDVIIFATGYKNNVTRWIQGTNLVFGKDPMTSFPNGWNAGSGLYLVGLTRPDLFGASADAVCVANDIGRTWKEETNKANEHGRPRLHRRSTSMSTYLLRPFPMDVS